jgi:hypothetical protein
MKTRKLIGIIGGAVAIAAVAGVAINNANSAPKMSDLMTKNLELLTQSEWDGWSIGYQMDRKWLISGGGVGGGSGSGSGSVEGEWIYCCERSTSTDACNRMGQSMLCN